MNKFILFTAVVDLLIISKTVISGSRDKQVYIPTLDITLM